MFGNLFRTYIWVHILQVQNILHTEFKKNTFILSHCLSSHSVNLSISIAEITWKIEMKKAR